jgi:hypothetical protein
VEKKSWLKTADADFDVGFYLYRGGPTVFFCLLPGKRLRGSGMTVWSGFSELELVMGRQRHDFSHRKKRKVIYLTCFGRSVCV